MNVSCAEHPVLHLATLRQGLYERLVDLDMQPRFRFAGEIRSVDRRPSEVIDSSVVIQDEFQLRIAREDEVDLLVVRHGSKWVSKADVAGLDLSRIGEGFIATRVSGEGPERGTVLKVEGDKLLLGRGPDQVWVEARDYVAALTVPAIARAFGSSTLRKVLVASGSLTANGRRNRYVVKRRFEKCRDMFARIGQQLTLPDEGCAKIGEAWMGIELQ